MQKTATVHSEVSQLTDFLLDVAQNGFTKVQSCMDCVFIIARLTEKWGELAR